MEPLFTAHCSAELARALGARPMKRLYRPDLSFPVVEAPRTHHAEFMTEAGRFAWLWILDTTHPFITRNPSV
jgi:hypothetical protein